MRGIYLFEHFHAQLTQCDAKAMRRACLGQFNLDIRAVIPLIFAGNLTVMLLLIAYQGDAAKSRPFRLLILSKSLQALAWPLLVLRGQIPDPLSIHLANPLLLAGFSLEGLVLSSPFGRSRKWERVYFGIFLFCLVLFVALIDTPKHRVLGTSVGICLIFSTASLSLFARANGSRLRMFLGAVAAAFAVILAFRGIHAVTSTVEVTLFTSDAIQWIGSVALFLLMSMSGLGFLLMHKENDDRTIAESEAKYRTLVEQSNEGILIIQDERLVFVNDRLGALLGIEAKGLVGSHIKEIVYPDDVDSARERHEKRVSGEIGPSTYDLRFKTASGEPLWVFVSASRIKWKGNHAVLAMITDINERKRLESEREEMIGELQRAIADVKTLTGLLPICASCKKIRDDNGYWQQVESFIGERTEAEFSHGICPDCFKRLYPEYADDYPGEPEEQPDGDPIIKDKSS